MLLAGVARRLLWRVHGDEGGISKRAFDGRGNGNDDTFLRFANSYNFVCSLRLDEVETSMTSRWKRSQSENKSSLSQEILRKLRPSLAPNNEDDVVVAPAGLLIAAPTRGSEITTYECTTRYYRVRHIPRDLEIRLIDGWNKIPKKHSFSLILFKKFLIPFKALWPFNSYLNIPHSKETRRLTHTTEQNRIEQDRQAAAYIPCLTSKYGSLK
ncbi:hypothetical protein HZH68_002364 [Vespula germanica]|uniref:Uncharacterized protein n=1 Tax=Vespula germanica TaxID=30212 RepID=A0A834KY49_VESGE|nr:hypothetical protein HZH68_002364 [Vespula germanica]